MANFRFFFFFGVFKLRANWILDCNQLTVMIDLIELTHFSSSRLSRVKSIQLTHGFQTNIVGDISTCTDIFSRLLGKYCCYSDKIIRMFINSNGKSFAFWIFKKYSMDQKLAYLLHTNQVPAYCTAMIRLRESPRRKI